METIEKQIYDEFGFYIRPLRDMVFVRTHPVPQMTESGLLYLSPRDAEFYGRVAAHKVLIHATVVAVGPKARGLSSGDLIFFSRLPFARWRTCEDGSYFGWLTASDVLGIIDDLGEERYAVRSVA